MLCPFKRKKNIENFRQYTSNYGHPEKIKEEETFCECDGRNCMAYDTREYKCKLIERDKKYE